MKNFKSKIIMSVLAVCVLALMLPVTVFAAVDDIFTADQSADGTAIGATMTFKVITEPTATENGTVQVGDGTNASIDRSTNGAITIPKTVTRTVDTVTYTYNVTAIGDEAFYSTALTSVTIPDSVTSIGDDAFSNCISLTSVTIPDSVTSIGDGAFASCTSLSTVTIGNSVTSIGDSAFRDCSSLSSVTIGNSVTSIGVDAFNGCTSLSTVTIPDSVTSIGERAFLGCALTSVTIPDGVTSIGNGAFSYCSKLTEIKVATGNTAYSDINGVLFDKDKTALIRYPQGKTETSYTIPNSVTSIGDSAFLYCTTLGSVTIPNRVTSIGNSAFYYCTSLSSVTIPDSVTSIGDSAFASTGLTSVTIPDSVTNLGDSTFSYCTSLSSVTIPDSVTSIGERAFFSCASLSSVTIPDSVTSIGSSAFYSCTGLTSVTIPDGVTSIGDAAFFECSSLSTVSIGNSVASIGNSAFGICTALTSVTIPDSVTSIGDSAFSTCTSLSSVTIGNGVTNIENFAFSNTALTSITIPSSVSSIGSNVFFDTDLVNIYFTGNMPTISGDIVQRAGINIYYPTLATEWDTYTTAGTKVFMTSYAVTNTLENMTSNGGPYIINDTSLSVSFPYETTLTANAGYALPQNISVLMNGTELTSGYDYSPTTGSFSITSSGITGDVEIVAQARALKTGADITGFSIAGQEGVSTIDTTAHTVTLTMPHGTDVTALVPTITVSEGATINPASGTAQNFTAPIFYTVTAENGEAQEWIISLAVAPAPVPAPTVPPHVTPQTGDNFNPIIWISISIISLGAVGFAVKKKA